MGVDHLRLIVGTSMGGIITMAIAMKRLRAIAAMGAARAGLRLNNEEFALLLESTPHAAALAKRIPHNHGNGDELASTFVLT